MSWPSQRDRQARHAAREFRTCCRSRWRFSRILEQGTRPARVPARWHSGRREGEDGGGEEQGDGGGDGEDKPQKRGGRRFAVECGCQPPRKLHMTPKQIEDGPVICGLCGAPFEPPGAEGDEAD